MYSWRPMMNSKNPYQQYEELFEGWPDVYAMTVRGEHGLRVAGRHPTPDNYKKANNLSLAAAVTSGAFLAWCFYVIYPDVKYNEQYDAASWAVILALAWGFVSMGAWLFFTGKRSLKTTIVFISPNHIQINGRDYDAKVQHKFTMALHRRAKEEERAEELAEKRAAQRGTRPVWRHFRYYRDSYHIFFEYLGQRILVTDIYKEEHAEKFLRGLLAADKTVHQEKAVFATNANTHMRTSSNAYESDTEESPGARAERQGYLGKRPALD